MKQKSQNIEIIETSEQETLLPNINDGYIGREEYYSIINSRKEGIEHFKNPLFPNQTFIDNKTLIIYSPRLNTALFLLREYGKEGDENYVNYIKPLLKWLRENYPNVEEMINPVMKELNIYNKRMKELNIYNIYNNQS